MVGRILILDDDSDLLDVCSIVLRSKNFEVRGLLKCNDILREARSFSPNVILIDNWIPDSGGVISTQLIKKDMLLKSVPVILFSANDRVKDLAAEAGAEFYLQKPFEIDELEDLVSRAISMHLQTRIIETS